MTGLGLRFLLLITMTSPAWSATRFYREDYVGQKVGGVVFTVTSVSVGPNDDLASDPPAVVYEKNIALYTRAMPDKVEANHVVVFPEYGLTSLAVADDRDLARSFAQVVPSWGDAVNPCTTYGNGSSEDAVRRLSCLAAARGVYLVVNVVEREQCSTSTCPPDGLNLCNTNVVFDRKGTVIERYRKQNLYGETALDRAGSTAGFFFTDFDVPFGLATSFDLLTLDAVAMTQLAKFTEVIVPFAWRGELPFLTPLQIQSGWHEAIDVSLITACYLKPSQGFSGCGLYFNNGLTAHEIDYIDFVGFSAITINATSLTEPEMSRSEEKKEEKELKDITFNNDDLIEYVSEPLIKTNTFTEIEKCHNTLCCKLSYELQSFPFVFHYQFLVFDGLKRHSNGKKAWANQVCGVVACSGDNKLSCGDPVENSTYSNDSVFKSLSISGVFNTTLLFSGYNSSLVMPSTMYNDLFVITNLSFEKQEVNDTHFMFTLATKNITKSVHTFALQSHDLKMVTISNDDSMAVNSKPCMLVILSAFMITVNFIQYFF